jgi:uncharacterized protein (TIGR00725 family)
MDAAQGVKESFFRHSLVVDSSAVLLVLLTFRGSQLMPLRRLKIIGVMGPHILVEGQDGLCVRLGELIARLGCNLLTGGGGGAMEVVCKAFTEVVERPGRAIGIIPGEVSLLKARYGRKADYPNPYIEIPIYTHLGKSGPDGLLLESRNHINVLTSDAIVVLEGRDGTLSEAHLAVRYGKPVIAFLSDVGRMPALDRLPIRKTNRLEDVEAFIRAAGLSGPAQSCQLNHTERPAHFRIPNF